MKGVAVNDDTELEHEANVMGVRAAQKNSSFKTKFSSIVSASSNIPVQMKRCPACEKENEDNNNLCKYCGSLLLSGPLSVIYDYIVVSRRREAAAREVAARTKRSEVSKRAEADRIAAAAANEVARTKRGEVSKKAEADRIAAAAAEATEKSPIDRVKIAVKRAEEAIGEAEAAVGEAEAALSKIEENTDIKSFLEIANSFLEKTKQQLVVLESGAATTVDLVKIAEEEAIEAERYANLVKIIVINIKGRNEKEEAAASATEEAAAPKITKAMMDQFYSLEDYIKYFKDGITDKNIQSIVRRLSKLQVLYKEARCILDRAIKEKGSGVKEPAPPSAAEQQHAERAKHYFHHLPHMAGEIGKDGALTGGHLLTAMRIKHGDTLRIDGNQSKEKAWRGSWSIGAKSKESTFFPSSWTEETLMEEIGKANREGDTLKLPSGITVITKGDTFYPEVGQ